MLIIIICPTRFLAFGTCCSPGASGFHLSSLELPLLGRDGPRSTITFAMGNVTQVRIGPRCGSGPTAANVLGILLHDVHRWWCRGEVPDARQVTLGDSS